MADAENPLRIQPPVRHDAKKRGRKDRGHPHGAIDAPTLPAIEMQNVEHISAQRDQPCSPNKELQEIHDGQAEFDLHLLFFTYVNGTNMEDSKFAVMIHSTTNGIEAILETVDKDLRQIGEKVIARQRITPEEGILLFEKGPLPFLGALANHVRERLHGDKTYFNRNFHIEPTNVCVFTCNFCSYSRVYAHRDEGWEMTQQQMLDIV